MDKKDLQELKKAVADGVREGFSEVWGGNLEPAFNLVHEKLDRLDERAGTLEDNYSGLDGKVAQLPTKTYIDDKFSNLEGDLIVKLKKEDQKVNRLAEMLRDKQVLTEADIVELQKLQIFPKESK